MALPATFVALATDAFAGGRGLTKKVGGLVEKVNAIIAAYNIIVHSATGTNYVDPALGLLVVKADYVIVRDQVDSSLKKLSVNGGVVTVAAWS